MTITAPTDPSSGGALPRPPLPPAPHFYVPLPRRICEDLRNSPVAIGVYALVARLYRIAQAPVPLSPADLQLLDPGLSYGAAGRALRRLVDRQYLVVAHGKGRKRSYQPSWGAVRGAVTPWDLAAPCLGRPRHIAALRLDQRLLDTCLGRLRPHSDHPAIVERYLARPLLGLADIGGYALALAGLPATRGELRLLGLLDCEGRPQPLPDDATILAVVSQRAAGENGLTPAGWARTAFGAWPAGGDGTTSGQALFFVPEDRIGEGIGEQIGEQIDHVIAPDESAAAAFSALESGGGASGDSGAGSHGIMEDKGVDRSTTPEVCGGGVNKRSRSATQRSRSATQGAAPVEGQPGGAGTGGESESVRLLKGIGVRADTARQLAARPAEHIAQVIAQGKARPGVRDLAAWVVSALRVLPESGPPPAERPPSPMPLYTHPGLSDQQRDRWIRRFRAALTPFEQRAVLARLEQEHPR